MHIEELTTPALIVVKSRVEANCHRMYKLAQDCGVQLRPHVKTSKCIEAALLQTGGTKNCLAVSTLLGAEKLFEKGFTDILYAYPLPIHSIPRCRKIAQQYDLCLMIDNREAADALQKQCLDDGKKWSVMMKINCENGRAGVNCGSKEAVSLATSLAGMSNINFRGVYAHCGDTYGAMGVEGVQKVATRTTNATLKFVEELKSSGVVCNTYGIGSTPSCSNPTEEMKSLTEWHPGNYVFYDKMQERIGSCKESDIACYVITRVVSHYRERGYMLIDCGWTAISLHGGGNCCGKSPNCGYGSFVGHESEIKLAGMSQEHGIVKSAVEGKELDFSRFPLGTLLRIYPDHSCATCAMHPFYHVVDDGENVIEHWHPYRGW